MVWVGGIKLVRVVGGMRFDLKMEGRKVKVEGIVGMSEGLWVYVIVDIFYGRGSC